MKKDIYAGVNDKPKKGNKMIILAAVLALCIAGVLYAAKLQEVSKYVTLNTNDVEISSVEEDRA